MTLSICLCTTPIRPNPTSYPPMGRMAIIQSLAKIGYDTVFYNIDYWRPSISDVEEYFKTSKFDIVAISAVVSTAYAYVKLVTSVIRTAKPKAKIIIGGNLAASAEILLKKCHVDFCVVGDGEFIIRDLIQWLEKNQHKDIDPHEIAGICFLDKDKNFIFTGFGQRPTADEVEYPDYQILEEDNSIGHFLPQTSCFEGHLQASERHIKALELFKSHRSATIFTAKGCVARCTFCHRWEKGYRSKATQEVMNHIEGLIKQYGVNNLLIADENFGSNKDNARELAIGLGKLGVLWQVSGVRVKTVTKEDLELWAKNGCLVAYFGIESGSQKMLDIMEKKATVEDNINGLRWTGEAGIATIIQLILGMPGEDDHTVAETIDFIEKVYPYILDWKTTPPSELISINYAQALPGTPLYEYLRKRGDIGLSIEDEEKYLLKISDIDAYEDDHFINCTSSPLLKVLMWRWIILARLDAIYLKKSLNIEKLSLYKILSYYAEIIFYLIYRKFYAYSKTSLFNNYIKNSSGYFNIKSPPKLAPLLLNKLTRKFFYPLLAIIIAIKKKGTLSDKVKIIWEHFIWSFFGVGKTLESFPKTSLRKTIQINQEIEDTHLTKNELNMAPLRSGR